MNSLQAILHQHDVNDMQYGPPAEHETEEALYFSSPSLPQHPLDQRSTDAERLILIITNACLRWKTTP
jgi:hypothetical protein